MTVERLPDGEVSTFLTDQLRPGDELDVRGPIGGWFVWPGDIPALLVGGGSGVVPLMAMLRLAGRLTARDLPRPPAGGLTFICGSSSFVDAAGDLVVGSGTSIPDIRIERFSPSGGHCH